MLGRWAVPFVFACATYICAQSVASLSGRVVDATGAAIPGAAVELRNLLTGFAAEVTSGADGTFRLANVPFQEYTLVVRKEGFVPSARQVALRSNLPVEVEVALTIEGVAEQVSVTASEQVALVDVEATGTRTQLNLVQMEKMPVPVGARGMEAVLVSFPGFAANANGAIHPRGAHNQMTYVIDGMPISDQLTGAFGNSVDTGVVQTIELFTGDIPAEYGSKVSGVANITTRSGLNTGRAFSGSMEANAAQFGQLANVTQVSGQRGRFGYFGSVTAQKTHRFLDQVSRDNLHNSGNAERGFARLDYQPGAADFLRVSVMSGRSSFQLANLRSQHANGQDQRQLLRDAAVSVGYIRVLSPTATLESIQSYRTSITQLFPSAGDTPVTAAQDRHLANFTSANRVNKVHGRHDLRGGLDVQVFPVSESFHYAVTDPLFDAPVRSFAFRGRGTGTLTSGFLQDRIRLGRLLLSLGLRYDRYSFLVKGTQWQPRVGAAYSLPAGTVLRASYNRIYQTPVNENLLLSSAGLQSVAIRPERQNVFELGVQQSVRGRLGVNATVYRKEIRNLHDNDNFFNTGIIFPTSLARRGCAGRRGE